MRVKKDWSKLLQPILLPLAFVLGIGSFILVADGKTQKPTILVVQLGTNWMDRNLSDEQMTDYLSRFVEEARRGTVEKIVWIAPPDSSRLRKVQGRVHQLLRRVAGRKNFDIIDSRNVTHYVMGKTGGDGIHYNSESSEAWARGIQRELDLKLALTRREKKLSSFTRDEGAQN